MKEEKIKNQNPWEQNKHSIIVFPLWKIHTKDKLKEFMMKQKQSRVGTKWGEVPNRVHYVRVSLLF